MLSNELLVIDIIGLVPSALAVAWCVVKGRGAVLRQMLWMGALVGGLDLAVELTGTTTGMWSYKESVAMIAGHVPIELIVMFICAGMLLGFLHAVGRDLRPAWNTEKVLLGLSLLGFGWYLYAVFAGGQDTIMLVFTVPLGLWGFQVIPDDGRRAVACLFALFVALLDVVLEVWAVGAGSYDYATGFQVHTPLTYALLTLAMVALLERRGTLRGEG
jgi:hypothetical protein